ncbi:hypothetical protein BN381_80277 [Candidatus Microthrix parvicella RN1]|uniref:Uncharacterized protein n=1 Tax=Candidatus Neomicrothrix parvicella RN1 TaxID=1229780 RepID=R4Z7M1_9ACTN|nr:hypothetical protein BN381_80277 [Candidatus Microthrix parvicella RN1]
MTERREPLAALTQTRPVELEAEPFLAAGALL